VFLQAMQIFKHGGVILDAYVKKLIWDSEFFNMNIYQTLTDDIYLLNMDELNNYAKDNGIDVLYHFQDAANSKTVYVLEKEGYNLVENRVDLVLNLNDVLETPHSEINVTEFDSGLHNIEKLYPIASMVSNQSRFRNDRNFDSGKIDELYNKWIYNSCFNGFADRVYIYTDNDEVNGLCIFKIEKEAVRLSQVGVKDGHKRKGIGRALLLKAVEHYKSMGYEKCYVCTQMKNISAINFYIKNGFKFDKTILVYHKWYKGRVL
jgi:ribosomal protein S18 acetylase RimI-like enzyme